MLKNLYPSRLSVLTSQPLIRVYLYSLYSSYLPRTMPKSSKKNKGGDLNKSFNPSTLPVYSNKDGCVEIRIVAKPGAKVSCVTAIEEEGVSVQISAPPVDGEANEELVKFMSKTLGLRKSCVSLSKGAKSRQKTLLISECTLTIDDVLNKLKFHIDS